MANGQTTTYPKAKLAEIKRRGATFIAFDLLRDMTWRTGEYFSRVSANRVADRKLDGFNTRQLYQFLRDNGYTFNAARAIWQAAEVPE